MENILIVIPARGGSKRIPNKNLRPLAGRSLIAHTLEAIGGSGVSAPVILTTDSEAIADEGRRLGLQVPFLRPAHMADDTSPTVSAVLHSLDWFCDDSGAAPDADLRADKVGRAACRVLRQQAQCEREDQREAEADGERLHRVWHHRWPWAGSWGRGGFG